jgi:hypothetical protein
MAAKKSPSEKRKQIMVDRELRRKEKARAERQRRESAPFISRSLIQAVSGQRFAPQP